MAVNVPLVHISDLTEQTTAADTDLMVIGGADAKKIKWSTIISLIKTKLNIGSSAISGIGDGTITGAISSLNSASYEDINSSYFGLFRASRTGNVTFIMLIDPKNLKSGDNKGILTLPEKFRPKTAFQFDAVNQSVMLRITVSSSSGVIDIYNYSSVTTTINLTASFSYMS